MVVVDEVHNVAQRVEPGVQGGVIETQAAVHDQARQPSCAYLHVEQIRVVEVHYLHGSSPFRLAFPEESPITYDAIRGSQARTSENAVKRKFNFGELAFHVLG